MLLQHDHPDMILTPPHHENAMMASLLAMHVGFASVLALALGLYTATPLLLSLGRNHWGLLSWVRF